MVKNNKACTKFEEFKTIYIYLFYLKYIYIFYLEQF